VAYCKDDKSKIETTWNAEYKKDSKTNEPIMPVCSISWNFEIAPNANSDTENLVSKCCIVPKAFAATDSFYKAEFLTHFNQ
jgi:hypothetical protein